MIATLRLSCATAFALATLATGCASIKSTDITRAAPMPMGVVYYLPTQHLVLTLTVTETKGTEGGVTTISSDRGIVVAPTTVVPDLEKRYLLAYRRHHVGISKASIAVGVNGLLTGESTGSTTSEIKKVLAGIATSLGTVQKMGVESVLPKPQNACTAPGTYQWVVAIDGTEIGGPRLPGHANWLTLRQCAMGLSSTRLTPRNPESKSDNSKQPHAGVFYRQALPMLVQVDDWIEKKTMTYTPTLVSALSPTNFLPIPRAAFSNVTWKLKFTDGIPTLFDIEAGSDVVGLVTWPADVIGAYAKAITAGFTTRKGELDAEADYLKAVSELAVKQVAAEACRVAVNGGDADKIKAACKTL